MNAEKYTQKSLEAVKAAQELTIQNQNQQIEQAHLLAALLRQDGAVVVLCVSDDTAAATAIVEGYVK